MISNIIPIFIRNSLKMDIGKNVVIARTAVLDTNVNPFGIHIGDKTWILRNAIVLAHDHSRSLNGNLGLFDTFIGQNCIIGVRSIILPGVSIGNQCVVVACAVVT